jgi:hypothetical protein
MEGRIKIGQEKFSEFIKSRLLEYIHGDYLSVLELYISLRYGDPNMPRRVPAFLAIKYKHHLSWSDEFIRQELEKHYRLLEEQHKRERVQFSFASLVKVHVEDYIVPDKKFTTPIIPMGKEFIAMPIHMAPQVFDKDMIKRIIGYCEIELSKGEFGHLYLDGDTLKVVENYVEVLVLLAQPENHIKVFTGQYREKPVRVRPVHDMTDEMAQELANLPRFTAYAKVIAENEGKQTVWKSKIKTVPMPSWWEPPTMYRLPSGEEIPGIESQAIERGHKFCKTRTQIEEEIRERQEKWRGNSSDEPPPTRD